MNNYYAKKHGIKYQLLHWLYLFRVQAGIATSEYDLMLNSTVKSSERPVLKNDFQNEWMMLHGDIEKYEKFSLVIKLVSVLVSIFSIAFIGSEWIAIAVILVLWLQDGIWKTFQKRLETRITFIEQELKNKSDENHMAFQLYSQWGDKRQGIAGLLKEYLLNSIKPTVAYPYAFLVLLVLIYYQLTG